MVKGAIGWCWRLVILAGILLLVAYVGLRVLSTQTAHYHNDIEAWLSERLGMPVRTGSLTVRWRRFEPFIFADEVVVEAPESKQRVIDIQGMEIHLALLRSLINRQFVRSEVVLRGLNTYLQEASDGSLRMAYQKTAQGVSDDDLLMRMVGLCRSQRYLRFEAINFHVLRGDTWQTFSIEKALFSNEESAQHVFARIHVQKPDRPGQVIVRISSEEGLENWARARFRGVVEATNLGSEDILGWERHVGSANLAFSPADGKVWLIKQPDGLSVHFNGQAAKLTAGLGDAQVDVAEPQAKGVVVVQPNGQWRLAFSQLTGSFHNERYEMAPLSVLSKEGMYDLRLSNVEIADLAKMLPEKFARDDPELPSISGDVSRIVLEKNREHGDTLRVEVQQLGIVHESNALSVQLNKAAAIYREGEVMLDVNDGAIDILASKFFPNPFRLDNLYARLHWRQTEPDGWRLEANNLKGQIEGQPFSTSFRYLGGKKNHLALVTDLNDADIPAIRRLIPLPVLSKNQQAWMNAAFDTGKIAFARVLFHGDPKKFPFNDHSGVFEVAVKLDDAYLKFDSAWKPINTLSGVLIGTADQLHMHVGQGKIGDMSMTPSYALLSGMGIDHALHLRVHAGVGGRLEQALDYLRTGPLAKGLAQPLREANTRGPFELDLDLDIPLHPDELVVAAEGLVVANGATIDVPGLGWPLRNINGPFHFVDDFVSAEAITATLFDNPVGAYVTSKEQGDHTAISVQFAGNVNINDIDSHTDFDLSTLAAGEFPFTGALLLPGNNEQRLTLSSDLSGVEVKLPPPFAKDAQTKRSLYLEANADAQAHEPMRIDYGNDTRLAILERKDGVHIGIALNKTEFAAPPKKPGIAIEGKLKEINLDTWTAWLAQRSVGGLGLTAVDLSVGNLFYETRKYPQIRVRAQQVSDAWQLDLTSPQIDGRVIWPDDPKATKSMIFERLSIPKSEQASTTWSEDVINTLVPLNFDCRNLVWGDNAVGRLKFSMLRNGEDVYFKEVGLYGEGISASGKGLWRKYDTGPHFSMDGMFETRDLGEFLKRWELGKSVRAGDGRATFSLAWPGTLFDLSQDTAQGKIDFAFRDGRLTGMNPGLGRVFSLLSIDNIRRRLKLDFSDVLAEGFTFDRIDGLVALKRGVLKTDNVIVSGPSARIELSGKAHVTQELLDLDATVFPNVTGSLPLAAAIAAGNPAVGAAVWVFDKVFNSQIEEISQYRYQVKGTFAAPQITPIRARG